MISMAGTAGLLEAIGSADASRDQLFDMVEQYGAIFSKLEGFIAVSCPESARGVAACDGRSILWITLANVITEEYRTVDLCRFELADDRGGNRKRGALSEDSQRGNQGRAHLREGSCLS